MSSRPAAEIANLSFAGEAYIGLPGSGKSSAALREVYRVISEERRPVFTNLPLRWRVFRTHLRHIGGEPLAGLLYELTEDHLSRFLERHHLMHTFIAAEKSRCAAEGVPYREKRTHNLFRHWHGPHVLRGVNANWIALGSVIVLDEVHKWYPGMVTRGTAKETPHLREYVTMHRHSGHRIIWITQAAVQVTKTLRDNTKYYWEVRNLAEHSLCGPIRMGHLGLKALGYVKRTAEQVDGTVPVDQMAPLEQRVIFTWLPKHAWYFRLYDSFSHTGGVRRMAAALRQGRVDAGLEEDGRFRTEPRDPDAPPPLPKDLAVLKFIRRLVVRTAVLAAVGLLAWLYGRGTAPVEVPEDEAQLLVQLAEPPPPSGRFSGVGDTWVRLDGRRVFEGDDWGQFSLWSVDRSGRRALFIGDGVVWLWELGSPQGERLGTVDSTIAALARAGAPGAPVRVATDK